MTETVHDHRWRELRRYGGEMIISHEKIGEGWKLTDRYGQTWVIQNDEALYFMSLGVQALHFGETFQDYLKTTMTKEDQP
jgi:hypothetical protein